MSEDITTQPVEEQDLKKEFPGNGRSKDEVPGDAPFEKVKEKFANIIDGSKSEGRVTMRVINENGEEKDRLEHRRIGGPGSVEIRPFEEKGKFKWGMKRMDKLRDGGEQ